MCVLASLLNPSGQGKKVVYPEKVRGKYRFARKKSVKIFAVLGKVGKIFPKKSV